MSDQLQKQKPFLRNVSIASAIVLGLTPFLAACSGGSSAQTSPNAGSGTGGTINARLFSDPSSFDPALAAGFQTFQFDRQLFDTILRRDEDGLVGGLASDWTAKTASDYNFTIRQGATCSDGSPITASVVANSLKYLSNPTTGSTWSALVFGQSKPTIVADDKTSTVHITLSKPFADLQSGLTVAQTGVICPAGLADLKGLKAGTVKGAFSGPYALTESKPGLSYTLTFRKAYSAWPAFQTPLKGHPAEFIKVSLGNDESTTGNQMLGGQVDISNFADWNTINRFKGNAKFHQEEFTGYTTYVIFNQRSGRVFADHPEWRKAVAQSIDQKGFNNVFSHGNADLLTSIVPKTYDCANTDKSLLTSYDPSAAKNVLSGAKGIKMLGNTANVSFSNGADYLYAALTTAGASVKMTKVDNATYWTTIKNGKADWDVTFIGDVNAGQNISASLDRTMSTSVENNGRNFSGSKNPTGEAALEKGLATTDMTERCAAFATAQETLFDRNDVVPLVAGTTVTITSENLTARRFGEDVDAATWRLTK